MTNQGALKTSWSNKSFTMQIRQERHFINVQIVSKLSILH